MRKIFSGVFFLAVLLTPLSALAAAAPASPYIPGSAIQKPVHPWVTLHLPKSLQQQFAHSAVEVFEYGCPFCRDLNSTLRTWGRTLPKGFTFTQMPALLGKQYLPMTLATFAVEDNDPGHLSRFENAAFELVQGYHEPIGKTAVYIASALRAGIPAKTFIAQTHAPETLRLTKLDYLLMRATGINQTPTLVLCGRYSLNPSQVHGNYSFFLELANGLLSRCIRHPQP